MSKTEMDVFLRFYLIPGFGHGRCFFDAGFDALDVLNHWLDTSIAPDGLVVVDNNQRSLWRSRPLCVVKTLGRPAPHRLGHL